MYLVKTPLWLTWMFSSGLVWRMATDEEPCIYITFDDGPHPIATPFALDQLAKHNSQATFFCVGNNVVKYPGVYQSILERGHTTGNHTFDHVNGINADTKAYTENVSKAWECIDSDLFRPPYGRIKRAQVKALRSVRPDIRIIMWSILSGDFDTRLTGQQCLKNVLKHIRPGSIILFHDSEKAWPRMNFALPRVLDFCDKRGWKVKAIPQ